MIVSDCFRPAVLACILLAGCSDSYYENRHLVSMDLIHADRVAYLELSIQESVFRQSPRDAARSAAGGWPITTENATRIDSIVFEITGQGVTRYGLADNLSVVPVGDRACALLSAVAADGRERGRDTLLAMEGGRFRRLPPEEQAVVRADVTLPLERHYENEGWTYVSNSDLRRRAERGEALRLALDDQTVVVRMSVRPAGDDATLRVEIEPQGGRSVTEEFPYHYVTKSSSEAEWKAIQSR